MFLVECKTLFVQQSYAADQQVKVQVFLRSSAPLSLKLRRLAITYTDRVRIITWQLGFCWVKLDNWKFYYSIFTVANDNNCFMIIFVNSSINWWVRKKISKAYNWSHL